jgi:CRISPR-associated protein Cas2
MRKLYAKVVERVNPQEDDECFYGISEEAVSRVLVMGGSPPQPPPTIYII